LDFARQQRNPGRHALGLGVVLGLHLLLAWALVSGLARRVVEVIRSPVEARIIEEVRPPAPPPTEQPRPPPPRSAPPPPAFVPPPEVAAALPPATAPAITATPAEPAPAPVAIAALPSPETTAVPPAARLTPRPVIGNINECAPRAEDYPPAAVRAEATGTTVLRFTVGSDGKLLNAQVLNSAGPSREHKLLDRVALNKLGECRFKPGVDENGRPASGTLDFTYVWKLE
jgi:protein TonB